MGVQAKQDMFHAQEPLQSSRTGAFTGRGRTLAGDASPQQAPTAGGPVPPAQLVHTITFYTNGIFTVNDSALPCLACCFPSSEALHWSVVAVPHGVMASIISWQSTEGRRECSAKLLHSANSRLRTRHATHCCSGS